MHGRQFGRVAQVVPAGVPAFGDCSCREVRLRNRGPDRGENNLVSRPTQHRMDTPEVLICYYGGIYAARQPWNRRWAAQR